MNELRLLFLEHAALISLTRTLSVMELFAKMDVPVEPQSSHRAASTGSWGKMAFEPQTANQKKKNGFAFGRWPEIPVQMNGDAAH